MSLPGILVASSLAFSSPSPELPGIDIRDLPQAWGDTTLRVNKPYSASEGGKDIGRWQARSAQEQLESDEVLLGLGEGAVFVPAMTQGRVEPRVTVLDANGDIASIGPSGRRMKLRPGEYTVLFGSGAQDQRLRIPVHVDEGKSSLVPIPWSGLTVSTIAPDRQHFQGEYKLTRQDRFQAYGEGFGQTEERLSDLQTWILPPGVYKITGLSTGADDLTNFVTVRLLPGEWIEYTLVMDGAKVVGGGMLPQAPTDQRRDQWRYGVDLGGSISWTREKLANQIALLTNTDLTGFGELRARRETNDWFTTARLQYVGGATISTNDDWRLTPDEVTGQLFTVWRATPRLGPYARVTGSSHLFPADFDLSTTGNPLALYVRNDRTGRLVRNAFGGTTYEYAQSFAPLELRQGMGLNIDAVQSPAFEMSLQAGVASRQLLPFGAHVQRSLGNPALLAEVRALDSTANALNSIVMEVQPFDYGTGFEGTGELRGRLGSSATITVSPGVFWSLWPRDEFEFSMTSVLSLHVSRGLSVDFRNTVKKTLDESAIHQYPYSLQVLLRFSFGS